MLQHVARCVGGYVSVLQHVARCVGGYISVLLFP